jgi:Fur family peroxide stress response transcriptional regulator
VNQGELSSLLRGKGFKATPQRLAILKALMTTHKHPTAERIFHSLRGDFPTLSLATVYKTLEMLKTAGLVSQLDAHGGGKRYDANTEPHCHLVCSRCGRMDDLVDPVIDFQWLPRLAEHAREVTPFAVKRPELYLYGICPGCQE